MAIADGVNFMNIVGHEISPFFNAYVSQKLTAVAALRSTDWRPFAHFCAGRRDGDHQPKDCKNSWADHPAPVARPRRRVD
jgi:hypothetical protein